MTLHILEPGLLTLLVDLGRPGARSLGVSVGGAADPWAYAFGNALVGNRQDVPALEINLAGPTLRADCPLACVVYGAPFALFSDRQSLRSGCTFTLEADEVLRIGSCPQNMRAYFCVQGGFDGVSVLESRSSLTALQAGEVLPCSPSRIGSRFLPEGLFSSEEPHQLRVLAGAQSSWFTAPEFYEQTFRVSAASNRMGLRLVGKPLTLPNRELVSEPVCPGSVQVTRDGQCIILGVDGQTIGGYPKIAQVISADAPKLGQFRPDDRVGFQLVEMDEAIHLYRQQEVELAEWKTRLHVTLGQSL